MNNSKKVRSRVDVMGKLELFSIDDIVKEGDSQLAVMKELSRLYANGEIKRLRKGIYYKPKESRFGELEPAERNILKYLLYDKGKRVGYVSGQRTFNYLGLTSQIPSVITIASDQPRRSSDFAGMRIRYVKAYGNVHRDDIRLLQILDSLKDVDKIFDARVSESLYVLSILISRLSNQEKKSLIEIAKSYPPRVRALVGAMLSKIWENNPKELQSLISLRSKIQDSSRFEFPNSNKVFKEANNWNIYDSTSK